MMLRERFGVSERRACTVVGQHRSTQRLDPPVADRRRGRAAGVAAARSPSDRPRWGWRRAAKEARREGWQVNDKRIQRLWREEGLRVPYRKRKKPLRGVGTAVGAMCPIAPNALWALDFQFDITVDGRTLKLLNIVDEFTRECPAIVVDRSIDADRVVATLDRLAARPRARRRSCASTTAPSSSPTPWPTGAGSTASTPCSSTPARRGRTPGSRSFNGRLRDELLNGWQLRQPPRSPSPHRGLAHRLQHQPAPHRPRRPHPHRVRPGLDHPTPTSTRIAAGPLIGARSVSGSRTRRVGRSPACWCSQCGVEPVHPAERGELDVVDVRQGPWRRISSVL